MSLKLRVISAIIGASAMMGAVGVNVAEAGSFPKGGSFHSGGEGATVEPSPDPTTMATMSFAPQMRAELPCGASPWGGGCG
ncbi:MAG: hypothetical protein AB7F42_04640 [Mycolicibacterium sp.]